jgi:cytochrome c oxidase subunit IV
MAFLFGPSMPIMYPIIFCCVFVQMAFDRLLLVYYYERPPAYNVTVTLLVLDIMYTIPFLSLPLIYW